MMAGAAAVAVAAPAAGCGGDAGDDVAAVHLTLGASNLAPADVASVELLVLGGANPTCAAALAHHSPLDDSALEVLVHGLFAVDGASYRISVPAGRHLVFHADAFKDPDGRAPRIGRGCAEATLAPGSAVGVPITLTATTD
jgi:hypothetical protein